MSVTGIAGPDGGTEEKPVGTVFVALAYEAGTEHRKFKLPGDLFVTPDGLATMPYIRESRRIKALKTILQQEVVAADSSGTPHQTGARAALRAWEWAPISPPSFLCLSQESSHSASAR